MWLNEIELESTNFKLIPLCKDHSSALVSASSDGNLWDLWYTSVPDKNSVEKYISKALEDQANGLSLPFVVIDKSNDKIIGSTRFCNVDPLNQRVEIGYTWYSKSYQKTACNTECKLLLLSYAFDCLDVIAVQFCTNWHNHTSRAAIGRLGAKQDGVLRNHQKLPSGGYRDTVVFSIINSEWLSVKMNLEHRLSIYN